MKKLWMLAAAAGLLSACNGTGLTPTADGDAYRINLSTLGYSKPVDPYIVPSVTVNLVSNAGAPDVREVTYTAVLLNSEGKPAAYNNSPIVPATGTMLAGAKGGYVCTTTAAALCTNASPDATWATNGSWTVNTVSRFLVPIEWVLAHNSAYDPVAGDTAQWYAEFTYTVYASNNKTYTWKQRYQFVSPATNS